MSVATWKSVGRLMYFPKLDGSGNLLSVYTIGWRILDNPDEWTRRFMGFKEKREDDVKGGALVLRDAVTELIAYHGFPADGTCLTTALSSGSTGATPGSALYRTGRWISNQVGILWRPDIFTKEVYRSLHFIFSADDRDKEVANKYRCEKLDGIKRIFILDDFVTRGATLGEMVRALSDLNPAVKVIGLALGKNERKSFAESFGVNVNNSHIPREWDILWGEGKKRL